MALCRSSARGLATATPLKVAARGLTGSRREVVIVGASRTPIGSFRGSLSGLTASQLGAVAIRKALHDSGTPADAIEEAFLGNVLQAGQGQAPGRQAVLGAGLPQSVRTTTINKVCSSGMKSVILAAQSIALGDRDVILAGGFESMSNAPYYLNKGREGYGYGHGQLTDSVLGDGLWDPYNNIHMGNCAEKTCRDVGISREDQDAYAIRSYTRAQEAQKNGLFKEEMAPVTIKGRKGTPDKIVSEDEEPGRVNFDKMKKLKSVFEAPGTITAANASKLNDGAVALVVMSRERAAKLGLKPLARVVAYGEAEIAPIDFSVAPVLAVEEALKRANLKVEDVNLWEVNEAFSAVPIAHQKHFGYSMDKLNVNGGAVSMGHPIGMSGARILTHLVHALKHIPGSIGCASICNGGGGGSAIIIESL